MKAWTRRYRTRHRGIDPPEVEETRQQEVRRWQRREADMEAGEGPGKTTFRRTLVYPPGTLSVTIQHTTPKGPYMAHPERMTITTELDKTLIDDEGQTWRYGDWSNFRFMSLCPDKSEPPTKTDIENGDGSATTQSDT